ncbi:hypothetical protein F2Q70_00020352 [Brassica cretica]|uniref:Uncharacterized protein n=1 Tax=Brassica cretica TaxID=69181 RepID=A0A8S9GQC7_BRACR|nr:hypothetical protein F2Q70_00020352 [Brassica cretica]
MMASRLFFLGRTGLLDGLGEVLSSIFASGLDRSVSSFHGSVESMAAEVGSILLLSKLRIGFQILTMYKRHHIYELDMRQGRPQLTLSEPSAMAPSSAPPGVVPPGTVPHTSVGSSSAVPAAPAPYVRRREDALLRAPSRHNQPHLHLDKLNGALCWNFVAPEKKDQWWHAFIQHYYWEDQFHDEIYLKWKKQTQVTVCGRISQNRRDNRQPSYMSDTHWTTMVEKYSTEQAKKKKSAKAAKSHKSASDGKKMHKHGAGPRCFLNIEYKMMVDEGLDEPPSYTALARKTHTGKDGSFLDERTEELVLEVEEAVEEMLQDGSPLGDIQTDSTAASNSKRYLLNQEYIKGKTKKGTVYGLGSVQYKNSSASVPIPVSLKRNLDVDMRTSGFETTISEFKEDIAGVKEDFSALKTEINAFKTEVTGGMSAS